VGLQSGSTNDQRSCGIYKHAYLCFKAEMQDQKSKVRMETLPANPKDDPDCNAYE